MVDLILNAFGFYRKSFLRLTNSMGPTPYEVIETLDSLELPVPGYEIMRAFRDSGIGLRMGVAKINKKMENIILLDLKFSGYERFGGRFTVYIFKKTDDGLNYVCYFSIVYKRLPNRFEEIPWMLDEEFI